MTFTVDIHHHMLPDFFWRATNEGGRPVGGIAPPPWSRASTLSFLDDAGIDANPELTTSERAAILGGTAAKLIPRLASLRSRTQRQAS